MLEDPFDGILSRDQIRTMISVAKQGSFHRAAASLGVKQPAVNQLVKRLEDKVGRRLFDRTPTGVTLTVDGEAVLIYAQSIAKVGAEMARHFSNGVSSSVLRIGIGEEFSRTTLPTVLGLFTHLHSNLRFEAMCVTPSDALFATLDEGRLDVVVARQDPAERSGEPIWTEPTTWLGRAGLALPVQDPIPLVVPSSGVLRRNILESLRVCSRTWRVAFEGGSFSVLEAAVQAGLGVSACAAGISLRSHIVKLDETAGLPPLPQSTFVLERAASARSAPVEAFCDALRTAARLALSGQRTDTPD